MPVRAALLLLALSGPVSAQSRDSACASAVDLCRASSPTDKELLAELRRKPRVLPGLPNVQFVVIEHACRAAARKDPSYCDRLADLYGSERSPAPKMIRPYAQLCREFVEDASLLRAIAFKEPGARARCLAHASPEGLKPGSVAAICGLLLDGKDPKTFAAALKPYFVKPPTDTELHHAAIGIRELAGDGSACREMIEVRTLESACPEFAAFHEAAPAGAPAACGGRGLCRVMMGEGEAACDVYRAPVRDLVYCPLKADRETTPQGSCVREAFERSWEGVCASTATAQGRADRETLLRSSYLLGAQK